MLVEGEEPPLTPSPENPMPRKPNFEALYRGRSHRKGEGASDARASGAARKASLTIRQYRDRAAREARRWHGMKIISGLP
jgi:hypothetical protein